MSTELQPNDILPSSPPPMDESYWSALLDDADAPRANDKPDGDDAANGKDVEGWHPLEDTGDSSALDFSRNGMGLEQDWEEARLSEAQDHTVQLEVSGFNRGGLLVSWNSLRGFVPASQLVDFPVDAEDEDVRQRALANYVDKRLALRIIELDVVRNRLILSERAAQIAPGQRANVLEELVEGQASEGVVTNLCDFGAFVDLGGVEGLIHISELSWGRIGHPRDVLARGDKIRVHVMEVNSEEGRVALSFKRLQEDPWQAVEERYEVGQYVEGVITNVVEFGAFACIEDGLEGLIHVSELAEGQFLHPRNVVGEGDTVKARIINIDGRARRLGLSLRTLEDDESDSVADVIM